MSCPFCGIVAGALPSTLLGDGEHGLAIHLHITPRWAGDGYHVVGGGAELAGRGRRR
jgi:diadenosine tetraphosphate (Ap4A) HIT family hydrolase